MVAAWMSGYFRGARNQLVFDFTRFNTNGKLVSAFCKKNGGADERHSEERTLSKRVMLSVACAWPVPDEPQRIRVAVNTAAVCCFMASPLLMALLGVAVAAACTSSRANVEFSYVAGR